MVLTTWLPEDFEDLSGLHSDAETMRWIRPGRPETPDETRARLASYLVDQEEGAAKWRVEDRRSGGFVGRAGFGGDVTHRELGYTLRLGFGVQCVKLSHDTPARQGKFARLLRPVLRPLHLRYRAP